MTAIPSQFVSTGQLPPDGLAQSIVREAFARYRSNAEGHVATYIPALATVPPDLFGICIASTTGRLYSVGDTEFEFSLQSVSKPFVFALVCQAVGAEVARRKLGVNSTGLPFNSVMAIELHRERTVNPLVNAGAIATSSLVPGSGSEEKWNFIHDGLSRFAGRELSLDTEVYESEASSNQRNQSLAWLLESYGRIYSDPILATDLYTRQCSLNVTTVDLALMSATLANGGVNPLTKIKVIDPDVSSRVLALMATAGLYETSGDWLYDCGLPGKSGVSGGIVTIAPGKGGMGTFAPRLDDAGNSVKGQLVAKFLAERLGLNLFASSPVD